MNFLYRPTKNEVLAYALERFRTGYGGRPIPRDDIRAFISALRKNECVWYAPDQSYRKKGAEMVPLFGIPAATNTLTSRLARMTGATVLPYFLQRLPGTQGYRRHHPPAARELPERVPGGRHRTLQPHDRGAGAALHPSSICGFTAASRV